MYVSDAVQQCSIQTYVMLIADVGVIRDVL